MRRALAGAVKHGLASLGHYRRRLARDRFPGVAVLCFHNVRPVGAPRDALPYGGLHVDARELESYCALVAECCDPIDLATWRKALSGNHPLPARPVLFTFDDGYRGVATVAQPILARFAIPAVVFVCGDPIAEKKLHWYDALFRARGEAEVDRAKRLPHAAWRALVAEHVVAAARDDLAAPLTVEELAALAVAPGIEIGSHTASHPNLARATVEEQRAEIGRDVDRLEKWCGKRPRAFAYPTGTRGVDYSDDSVALVREAGFDFGFTTDSRWALPSEPALERSRFTMTAGMSAAELAHRLCYSWAR